MAADEELVARIRQVAARLDLRAEESLGEIKMFGGLCFCINRKMLIGVGKSKVMVRLGDADIEEGLEADDIEPMDFTGKPLRNFAYLKPKAYEKDAQLLDWIEKSTRFVRDHMVSKPTKRKR